MDNPEPTTAAAGELPELPPEPARRRRWPIAVAVVALAAGLASVATMRAGTDSSPAASQTADVNLAALSAQSPLALPLYQGLVQQAAGAAAPVAAAAAPAADAPAAVAPAAVVAAPVAATTPTSSMPMPSGSVPAGGSCVPKAVLQPIIDHIKTAHLETSPGQQAQDLLNLDQYVKTHTVWLETVLAPAFDGSADKVLSDTLAPIIAHIKSAHLETSLGQQVSDLLNVDQYIKTHTVWLESVLTPLLDQATC
jgi:predicted small metal-binding protein